MKYQILGSPLSPFVRKVRVACAEKGIDYDIEPVSPFNPPEGWAEISPLGRIPVLALIDEDGSPGEEDGSHGEEDGSQRYLPDSSVICAFLEQMHPGKPLLPAEPIPRGQALWLEEYADSDLAATIGLGIFRPVVISGMSGGDPDLVKARNTMETTLPPFFDYLQTQLGDNEYFVKDRLTLADIAVATSFVNMAHAGFSPDESRWPQLTSFLTRMHERQSFADCIAGERALLSR